MISEKLERLVKYSKENGSYRSLLKDLKRLGEPVTAEVAVYISDSLSVPLINVYKEADSLGILSVPVKIEKLIRRQ